jgi:hypothetical protein
MKIEQQGDEWVVWRESDSVVRFIFDNEQDALEFYKILKQEGVIYA